MRRWLSLRWLAGLGDMRIPAMKVPKNLDGPTWFFVWTTGQPYMTTACGWYRKQVIREMEQATQRTWKQIYAEGGRAVRCDVRILS